MGRREDRSDVQKVRQVWLLEDMGELRELLGGLASLEGSPEPFLFSEERLLTGVGEWRYEEQQQLEAWLALWRSQGEPSTFEHEGQLKQVACWPCMGSFVLLLMSPAGVLPDEETVAAVVNGLERKQTEVAVASVLERRAANFPTIGVHEDEANGLDLDLDPVDEWTWGG